MLGKYKYIALPHHAIRLLELRPGKADEKLVCSMRTVHIGHTPPYEAISYVWGNPERTSEILCDEQALDITASLSGALQRVRRVEKTRLLWADAICINQSNLRERGEQVQLMRSIYQQAKEVLVWLGPEDEDGGGEEVFKFLNRLWEDCSGTDISSMMKSGAFEILGSFKQLDLQTFPSKDSPFWYLLHCFYRQPWFTRVWIIQEVAVSTSALIMYGKEEISWQKLGLASALILSKTLQNDPGTESGYEEHLYNSVSNASLIWGWSSANVARNEEKTLAGLLDAARNFAATDPRDKIYALLGLVDTTLQSGTKENSLLIVPDYILPYYEVYRAAAAKIIFDSKDLDILSAVEHESPKFTNLPSWVPVWNRAKKTSSLGTGMRSHYRTSGTYTFIPRKSQDENCLIVPGLVFDTITQLTSIMIPEEFYPEIRIREATATYHPWIDSMSRISIYPTGESPEVAYSLTLVANATRGLKPASEDLAQHLANFSAYLYDYFKLGMPEKYLSSELRAAANGGDGASFAIAARNMCNGRRFFVTEKGYIGIGPAALQQHDLVCIFFGGLTPFILRKEAKDYRFIGEAYVHGLMNGEAIQQLEAGELSARAFLLR